MGVDVVLGLEWLEELGEIKANFKELTLKFRKEGQEVVLRGDPSLYKATVSVQAMVKIMEQEEQGFLIDCYMAELKDQPEEPCPESVQQLLRVWEFAEVFKEPHGLPPLTRQDHAITLKEGASIPNLRPYKYPHYQKNEIEKLVGEMLHAGIIRPNYRTLNKVIVPDKFPIPVIDELLNELAGATIFSKLDLR
ncbi:hypothetical protein CR513_47661, partial [Mucuna pruriens]